MEKRTCQPRTLTACGLSVSIRVYREWRERVVRNVRDTLVIGYDGNVCLAFCLIELVLVAGFEYFVETWKPLGRRCFSIHSHTPCLPLRKQLQIPCSVLTEWVIFAFSKDLSNYWNTWVVYEHNWFHLRLFFRFLKLQIKFIQLISRNTQNEFQSAEAFK